MSDGLSELYQELLSGSYDCVDRIVLNAYFGMGHSPGGFRVWWRALSYMLEDLKKEAPDARVISPDPAVDVTKLVRSFIADFYTKMAVVEDRRTEFAMGIVNRAILAHQHAPWLQHVDFQECSRSGTIQVLSHCMKMSIAASWDLPTDDERSTSQPKDDFCNLQQAAHFADVCAWPLSPEATSEFQQIAATNQKDSTPAKAP